jgi:hypothetical protein
MNIVRDVNTFRAESKFAQPGVRVTDAGGQTISNTTFTAIDFDTDRWDEFDMHDTSTNNSRITCIVDGRYIMGGAVQWDANATGYRWLSVRLNGSSHVVADRVINLSAQTFEQSVSTYFDLSKDDYIELVVWQNSGGNLNTNKGNEGSVDYTPVFWAQRVG